MRRVVNIAVQPGSQLRRRTVAIATAMQILFVASVSANPNPVSPGAAASPRESTGLCPTFDIATTSPASAHEIVIYEVEYQREADPKPIAQIQIPAGATGWTPSVDQCLEPNRQYAWAVRAVRDDGPGEWSEPFFFRTPESAFTSSQLEEVTARVRQELEAASTRTHGAADPLPSRQPVQGTGHGDGADPDLAAVKAGVRSMPAELTGEVAGVVGVSQSLDGAGMIAANTNPGGADLVLEGQSHGAEDTIVTESGIEVGGSSFSINGQAGLTVLIDGSEAVTSDTIAQHDTLGMLNCAENQVAQWDGAQWVCKTLMLGDIAIPVPDAPLYVRVVPNYLDPSTKRLAWSMEELTGVANFIVYQSPTPITEANKHLATRSVANDLWVPITVIPDSGLMHFRVEAVNIQGVAGELSREYRLNTAIRIQFSVQDGNGNDTHYLGTPAGQLIEFTDRAIWSPGGSRYAWTDSDGTYITSEDGGTVKISDWSADAIVWSPDDYHLILSDFLRSVVTDREGDLGRDLDGFGMWSPTGEAFAHADPEPDYTLHVTWLDDDSSITVDTQAWVDSWRWSPDGTRLSYFKHKPTGRLNLWIAEAGGTTNTNLTDDLDGVVHSRWSPDGSRIAFGSFEDATGKRSLRVATIGGGRTTINPPSEGRGLPAFGFGPFPHPFPWSPDGELIAYFSDHDIISQYQVYVSHPTGGDSERVSQPPAYSESMLPMGVSWTDDGNFLAIFMDQKWDETFELFIWSREDRATSRIHGPISRKEDIFGLPLLGPRFSPDSRHIVYLLVRESKTSDLYVAFAQGGQPLKLNPDGTYFGGLAPTWVPQGWTPLSF